MPTERPTQLILSPKEPLKIAGLFARLHYTHRDTGTAHHQLRAGGGTCTLFSRAGEWFAWTGTHYALVEPGRIKQQLYAMLERCFTPASEEKEPEPFAPTRSIVENVIHALQADRHLDSKRQPPFHLYTDENCTNLLPCRNGLLDVVTGELRPHSPHYFTTYAIPFDYDPKAPSPDRWFEFLDDQWANDSNSISLLQEVMGLCLTGDTSRHKALMIVGPKRSGKSTIAKVMRFIVGHDNVAGPPLAALASEFGLQELIHKPVAIIPDARLDGRTNQGVLVERMLSITGEDMQQVNRKYLPPWNGKLPTRLWLISNEPPRLKENSGALASRFLYLRTSVSFFDREDHNLERELLREAPAILNWAIAGYRRLLATDAFSRPASMNEMRKEMEELSSPATAFVRDCCRLDPSASIQVGELYKVYTDWCEASGNYADNEATFGRNLKSAHSEISRRQKGSGHDRMWVYSGICRAH